MKTLRQTIKDDLLDMYTHVDNFPDTIIPSREKFDFKSKLMSLLTLLDRPKLDENMIDQTINELKQIQSKFVERTWDIIKKRYGDEQFFVNFYKEIEHLDKTVRQNFKPYQASFSSLLFTEKSNQKIGEKKLSHVAVRRHSF